MTEKLAAYLRHCSLAVAGTQPLLESGRLTRVAGLVMEATGLRVPVGQTCLVQVPNGNSVEAEVVGFAGERVFLMPTHDVIGLAPGASVTPSDPPVRPPRLGLPYQPRRRAADRTRHVPVGAALLGRVLDAGGRPLDRLGPLVAEQEVPLHGRPVNPLERAPIRVPLDVGVRAINALLPVGRGQRIGLFAGSGVGKSVLLGMMARYTAADVAVVGLIGERGREVREFIDDILGAEGLARSVVVAAPADTSPLMRLQAAFYSLSIAEYFASRGQHVLLIMDSLTRFAMAQREIALAIGEPPATRGYPPSVFARLPQLVERAGNGVAGGGSITAFFTVLMEGDDQQDPVADSARAILDGHIVLSRALADQGQYPAIDVEASISRVAPVIADAEQMRCIQRFKSLVARYQRNRDLLAVGAYTPGGDPALDEAVALYPKLSAFLGQGIHERHRHAESVAELKALLGGADSRT